MAWPSPAPFTPTQSWTLKPCMVGPAAAAPAVLGEPSESCTLGPAAAVCCLMRWLRWLQARQSSEGNIWLRQVVPVQSCLSASPSLLTPGLMSGFGAWPSSIMMSLGLAVGRMSTQRLTSQRPSLYEMLLVAIAPPPAATMLPGIGNACFLLVALLPLSRTSLLVWIFCTLSEGLGSLHEVMHLQGEKCQGLQVSVPGRQPFMLVACGLSV